MLVLRTELFGKFGEIFNFYLFFCAASQESEYPSKEDIG